jgi:hypothetical protein
LGKQRCSPGSCKQHLNVNSDKCMFVLMLSVLSLIFVSLFFDITRSKYNIEVAGTRVSDAFFTELLLIPTIVLLGFSARRYSNWTVIVGLVFATMFIPIMAWELANPIYFP